MTLLSGQTVPGHGFGVILRDALTGGVSQPEVVLRASIASSSCIRISPYTTA